MTGYGRGEHVGQGRSFVVEIQALNHRFLEVRAKLPRRLSALEHHVQALIQRRFHRGRFDLSLTEKGFVERPLTLSFNRDLAVQYLAALKGLQEEFGLPGRVTVATLSARQDLFEVEEAEEELQGAWGEVEAALEMALDALDTMRAKEGEAIQGEFLVRLARAEGILERIEQRAPEIPKAYKERLKARVDALLEGRSTDPFRLEQEVALFADRSDITEECARLKSHLNQFRSFLEEEGPHGRKLDFLLQEMGREANTIGAKASDASVSHEVILLKAELERLREQVQNLE
ncbi:MAG: YicC family protein [candidate division NC10 bacterium]|nr:YicC family protein [candidate division NC10 bacterium]